MTDVDVDEDRALLQGLTDEALDETVDRREQRYVAADDAAVAAAEASLARAQAELSRRDRLNDDEG